MKRWEPVSFGSLLAVVICAIPAAAKFALIGQPVPIPRLLENVAKYIAAHPKDAKGYYTLGRLHSLAFARGVQESTVRATRDDPTVLPNFLPYESIQVVRAEKQAPSKETLGHLERSLRNYHHATTLAPERSLYWLGLGWMLEQGLPFAKEVVVPFGEPPAKASADQWRERALAAYRKAYSLDKDRDLEEGNLGPGADSVISLEAGNGILRLLEGVQTAAARTEVTRVRATVNKLKGLPQIVTPIIFPTAGTAPLEGLLATEKRVRFDLAGDTRPETWSWLRADTGILVWDPKRQGRITSGTQLFGSVTWSMFWKDGYEPLTALDDSGDGWLSGSELDGLGVWCDRNQNAVSEKGEVRPVAAWGITRIGVHAQGEAAGVPFRERGIQRADGSYLPTYDWTPTSID